MSSTYFLFVASVSALASPTLVNVAPPKFTGPGTAAVVPCAGVPLPIVIVVSPFLITRSSLPVPVMPFMPVKVSANFTTNPFASVIGSFSTRIFVPSGVAVVVVSVVVVAATTGVKFAPPLTVNVVPNARVTSFLSSPVKVNGCAAIPFTVLIRASSLSTAAPTLLTVSVPPVTSSFVMLYVGFVNAPLASTVALPPRAVASSVLAVYNWPPVTASVDLSAILPFPMLDNTVPVVPVAVVVDPSGFTRRACGFATATASSAFVPSALTLFAR